ncbi:MAG TPA: protein-L-isoaspartate(D-aspartate) O-methyltransferase [Dictyoglomaceae bacterium]|nr:protein-L-isoaspartate(D-aspartate) O-methyltransferase [Dictyoglomaceae bacterium]HOL39625.1 protein-L-isoaspartate(D-aspartate) O-methyltransferase [Dictyoglomaceae bacterium]
MSLNIFDSQEYMEKNKRLVNLLQAQGITSPKVLNAILKIPRHLFVPPEYLDFAYEDEALPIGYGQTISQPYIVALMTESLDLSGEEKVLEIGTGSGYQTAILAELSKEVYTVERLKELSEKAQKILKLLGYTNIHFKVGDGTLGWREYAPYDRIIVTAGSLDIPQPLEEQMVEDGIMVIPLGNKDFQYLYKIKKDKGDIIKENLGGVRFVTLKGEFGWKDE